MCKCPEVEAIFLLKITWRAIWLEWSDIGDKNVSSVEELEYRLC